MKTHSLEGKTLRLEYLIKYQHADFASSPRSITINGYKQQINYWCEAAQILIRQLIANNDLTENDLPLVPTDRSSKAFVNNTDNQINNRNGKFKKIAENFYVDTKYNRLCIVKNMYNTLNKLMVLDKYNVTIEQ